MQEESDSLALSCAGVSKAFGGTRAVSQVSLEIQAGTIHALVGENGAGKSTLLGIVSGRVVPDEGSVQLFGHPLRGGRPRDLKAYGLATIYQELMMYPSLSALENVFAGQLPSRAGLVRTGSMRKRYAELCALFAVTISPDTLVRNLSVSQRQMLEIMRGVQSNSRILLLDEPSAALAENERENLHRVLKGIAGRGTTVVFVSHNLDEVMGLSDRISVMRDGRLIESQPTQSWSKEALIRAMIGRELIVSDALEGHSGEPLLEVSNVSVGNYVRNVSLDVKAGEIVGVWGLVGSGRTTLMRAVAGLEPSSSGRLRLHGTELPWSTGPDVAISRGIVMVPEDRKSGLVLGMDAVQNYWIGRRRAGRRGWVISRRQESSRVAKEVQVFGLNPNRISEPLARLSGGNQQKVMLTKWAGRNPKVFLIDEPTRGIDVGAKAEVLTSLKQLAYQGAGIVMTSSELEEVLAVSHRVLIFAGGAVVGEVDRGDSRFTVQDIVRMGFDGMGSQDVA